MPAGPAESAALALLTGFTTLAMPLTRPLKGLVTTLTSLRGKGTSWRSMRRGKPAGRGGKAGEQSGSERKRRLRRPGAWPDEIPGFIGECWPGGKAVRGGAQG